TAGDAFDRCDLGALGFDAQHEARVHDAAIEHDRACAAIAVVTALFGARQANDVAQALEQALAGLAEKLFGLAVDCGPDMSSGLHGHCVSLAWRTADSSARRVSTAHKCFR